MSTTAIWIIALLVIGAVIARRSGKRKGDAPKPAPNARGWAIGYSPGMSQRDLVPTASGWRIAIPTNPASHLHYVQNFQPPPLRVGGQITVRLRVAGGPCLPQERPDAQATASLLIQRRGDDWAARGEMASYRWYSAQQIPLTEGEHAITVTLTPSQWGDVYGGQNARLFADAIAHLDNIGIVFGSAGGRGHGVYTSAPCTVELVGPEVLA